MSTNTPQKKSFKRPVNALSSSIKNKSMVIIEENITKKHKIDDSLEITSKRSKHGVNEGVEAYNDDKTIYIEGLPYTGTEEDVKSFFSSIGHIASIRLPQWHDSGRLRGYGHIEFTERKYADQALGLDGKFDCCVQFSSL